MESVLFSPIYINTMRLPNRIVMPGMVTHYAGPNGEVTDRLIRYHVERAQGGCGLNIVEATYMHKSGNSYVRAMACDNDDLLPGLRRLTDAIHAVNGHIAIQLQHGGRTARPQVSCQPQWLVSQIPGVTNPDDSREMTEEDIQVLLKAYEDAAMRAKKAGFDAVELHGAHGYMPLQFMSPRTNHRNDRWGGSLENRARFALEVIAAVRARVGKDYPVIYRMSVDEMLPDGLDLGMAEKIAPMLVEAGIDALNVSVGGGPESNQYTVPSAYLPLGWMAEKAGAIRRAIGKKIPVIAVGRIHTKEIAESILENGLADLVAIGRGQIADPQWANKMRDNRDADVNICVSCNDGCSGFGARDLPISCAINPKAGNEILYDGRKAPNPKKVLVVGGGIAGMTAAIEAASRGHKVTLVEKSDRLGGLLHVACLPPNKELYGKLAQSKARELTEVDVRLSTPADSGILEEVRPAVIIAATGSRPLMPRFCAAAKNAVTADDVLQGVKVGKNVLILGGGLVGCETGEFLAEKGHDVTILELRDALAPELSPRERRFPMARIRELGIKSMLNTEVVSISEDGEVTVKDRFGEQKKLSGFDSLVIALGYKSVTDCHPMLENYGVPVVYIGDCVRPGKVLTATHAAIKAAYEI